MAKDNTTRKISIAADGKQAKNEFESVSKVVKRLEKALDNMRAAGLAGTDAFKKVEKSLKDLREDLKDNENELHLVEKVMNDLSGSTTRQLRSALRQLKKEMENQSEVSGNLRKMREQYKAIQEQIDKNTGSLKKQSGVFSSLLKHGAQMIAMYASLNSLRSAVSSVSDGLLKMSDELTDIRKVSGLTATEMETLSEAIMGIDSRTTVSELNKIAYAGSKLGIATTNGVEGLIGYTKAANQLGTALHEDLGDEAVTALAKMTQVMGDAKKMGVEKSLLSTGSAIFKLSTTSTSNGKNIVEFSKRLTGIAKSAKMTTPELLALGSAVDSMALMPETASTAMNKFIVALQTNYNLVEKDLKMKQGELKDIIENQGIMAAIQNILPRMKEMGGMNALNKIFPDLEGDGVRLKNVIVTLSQNYDMLNTAVETSNQSFREGTAVTKEYEMQNETAAAYMERAGNLWQKTFVNKQGVDIMQSLAKAWYDFTQAFVQSEPTLAAVKVLFFMISSTIKTLIELFPLLVVYLGTAGLTMAINGLLSAGGSVVTFFTLLTGAVTGNAAAVEKLTLKWQAMSTAMKANVIGLVVTAMVGLVYTTYKLTAALSSNSKAARDARNSISSMEETEKEASASIALETSRLKSLRNAIDNANIGSKERAALIKQWNEKFGKYHNQLLTERSDALDVAKAYNEVNKQLTQKALLEAKNKEFDEKVGKYSVEKVNIANEFGKATETAGQAAFDQSWLQTVVNQMMDNGLSKQQIYNAVMRQGGFDEQLTQGTRYRYDSHGRAIPIGTEQNKNASRVGNLINRYVDAAIMENKNYNDWVNKWKNVRFDATAVEGVDTTPYGNLDLTNPAIDKNLSTDKPYSPDAPDLNIKNYEAEIREWITNIKNFYTRQETAAIEEMTAQGIEKVVQDRVVDDIKDRMDEALSAAHNSLVTGSDAWNQFRVLMKSDIREMADETGNSISLNLLNDILNADVSQYRADVLAAKPKGYKPIKGDVSWVSRGKERHGRARVGWAMKGYKDGDIDEAYLASQFLRMSNSDNARATREQKYMEARRQEFLEHDYTGSVIQKTFEGLLTTGFANVNIENYDKDKQYIEDFLSDLNKKSVSVFSQNGNRQGIMSLLFGSDYKTTLRETPLSALLDITDEEFELFYQKLIQYSDEYTQAEKKAADERKKVNDYLWKVDGRQKSLTSATENVESGKKEYSRKTSFAGQDNVILPWGQVKDSPELLLWQMKLEMAKEYYAFLAGHQATDEQLIEANKGIVEAHSGLMDAVVQKAKATADAQLKWYAPIEEYGSALGEAVFDESKTVKDATQDMIKSFIKLTGEYVNQKLTQWVMTKLYNSMMATSEKELVATKQAAAVTNATTSVTAAGVEVAAGTAAGAAKTVGQLGWWGIPLVALIGAVLGGLMSLATGALSKAFGSSSSSSKTTNTKLVSGMLTYDSGNVQTYAGTDGNYYSAQSVSRLSTGIVTSPIATTVNGAPALVGERGPEIVVGRETTAAIMRNDPGLLRMLVGYDKMYSGRRRTYDEGNVSAVSLSGNTLSDTQMADIMMKLLYRLDNPIAPNINMYGRDGLHAKMQQANQFMKGK